MDISRNCSKRGAQKVLKTARSRRHTAITMEHRSQAPFDSSFRGQAQFDGFNPGYAAGLNTSATPFYPSSQVVQQGVQVATSTPDVQLVANAFQTVSIVGNSTLSQNSRHPPRPPQKLPSSRSQTDSPGTSFPSARETGDAKVQPSKASGGIPDPTNAYLAASNVIPRPLQEPQHLLVVIDLNGTLLFRDRKSVV